MFLSFLIALTQAPLAPKPIESLPPLVPDAQAVSPDHTRIAVSTRDEGVWVLDIATKTVAYRIPPTASVVEYVTWDEKGASIGLLHRNADIDIVDARSGAVTATLQSTSKNPVEWEKREIHFAAGGTVIVAALGGPPTDILPTDGGERIAIDSKSGTTATAFALSKEGETIALGDDAGEVTLWKSRTGDALPSKWRAPSNSRQPGIKALAFDPNGKTLAIGSGDCTARLWTIGMNEATRLLSFCDEDPFGVLGVGCVSFSPDGSQIVATSLDFLVVRVWRTADERFIAGFDYGNTGREENRAWFSSDGRYVTVSLDCKMMRPSVTGSDYLNVDDVTVDRTYFRSDGDYAWAVVDHHLVVRKIPDAEPVLRVKVRER